MLKFYILIALALTCQISKAQINFDYDNVGNRILKKPSGALPVTLISFTATKSEKTALLTWQTASEINADRFDIERSRDGKKWSNIGTVAAKGQSSPGTPKLDHFIHFRINIRWMGGPSLRKTCTG